MKNDVNAWTRIVPLRLTLDNYKAVATADIALNGLTVVCGPNATGKSTIAKTLRTGLEAVLYYRGCRRALILSDFFRSIMSPLGLGLAIYGNADMNDLPWREEEYRLRRKPITLRDAEDFLGRAQTDVVNGVKKLDAKDLDRYLKSRFLVEFRRSLQNEDVLSADTFEALLQECTERTIKRLRRVDKEVVSTRKFLGLPLDQSCLWAGYADLKENGESMFVFDRDKVKVFEPTMSVENVVYIESPLVSQPDFEGRWCHMPNNVSAQCHEEEEQDDMAFLKSIGAVIQGKISESQTRRAYGAWEYKRKDGETFPLRECATGIRSFAILSRLFKHGCLNDHTVLIIDEPEAHLHPSWIIEYAAILVKLVEKIGVRILVASHSPDMVNALQTLSICRGMEKCCAFYQAELAGRANAFKYRFRPLEINVERIFDSFNIAYDKLEKKAQQLRVES